MGMLQLCKGHAPQKPVDISQPGKIGNIRSSNSPLSFPPRDIGLTSPIPTFYIPTRITPSTLHLNCLSNFFRATVSSLALHSRTFFIHPSSISTSISKPLQLAISVSALSTLYSPSTHAILASNLSSLIADSHTTFYSPLSILHSVQALIIYQIIRLFSSIHKKSTTPSLVSHC
jgi:hypothetical protein